MNKYIRNIQQNSFAVNCKGASAASNTRMLSFINRHDKFFSTVSLKSGIVPED